MEDQFDYSKIEELSSPMAQALQAIAMRPQKNYVKTNTYGMNTPYEYADMLARRNTIGKSLKPLEEALKTRESYAYSLANALSAIPQRQGYGTWLNDFARSFGTSMMTPMQARVARAETMRENELADLETALKYDKEMGSATTQNQEQFLDYKEMPYSGGKQQGQGVSDTFSGVPINNFGQSVGYDPVKNIPDFAYVTRAGMYPEQMSWLEQKIPFLNSLYKGLTPETAAHLQTIHQGISENILSGKVLDFVGKAGGIRIADTPAEQAFIFGPLKNYAQMSKEELEQALLLSRNRFVAAGLRAAEKENKPVTEQELVDWFNSAFAVPKGMETQTMYNVQNRHQWNQQNKDLINRKDLMVGEVRNGVRFLGYNDDGSLKFERAQ